MASKTLYTVVAAAGIAAASGAAWWFQHKPRGDAATTSQAPDTAANAPKAGASAPAGGRAPSVEVSKIEVMRLVDDTQAVGNLKSRRSVMVRPEVGGRITQLNFNDGERIKQGQLLVQFDDQLPMAQVAQSKAELSIAQANHKRNQDLASQNFISARTVDESAAALEVAQAKLALAQATAARYKIIAPFDGMTGIRTVNPGDYLKDGADIVNIEDIDAVYVDFRLPERFMTKIKKGQSANVDLDALPGRKFSAIVQAIDPLIDANGRSVGIRACIDNRQLQLRPGMFARVTTVFGERERALVVPEEAIVPQGPKVFVFKVVDGAEPGTKVSQRVEVKVGIRRPGRVEVLEGLSESDLIVVGGQQRVQKDGTVVKVVDFSKAPASGASAPGAAGGSAAAAPAVANAAAGPAASPAPMAKAVPGPAAKSPMATSGPNPCLAELGNVSGQPGSGSRPASGARSAVKS